MDGFGGGDTYTYRTALYVSFPGRTIFSVLLGKLSRTEIWFCLGNYHKVQSYIYIYIYTVVKVNQLLFIVTNCFNIGENTPCIFRLQTTTKMNIQK